MRYYETIYILNTNYDSSTVDKCKEEVEKELKEFLNANIINHYIWTKKRLAYQIKKQKYGLFILLHFESLDTKKMPDFNKWMKLNSHIMRHMTVALDSEPEIYDDNSKTDKPENDEKDVQVLNNDTEELTKDENNSSSEMPDNDIQTDEQEKGEEDLKEIEKEQKNDVSKS
tara:strand:+ start:903 stop:1415 length:513 start_codon:yes stop_codon:yes gene_type:complete